MPSTRVPHLLDNIIWNPMSGPQWEVTEGSGHLRRFARGFSPLIGFSDLDNPRLDEVRRFGLRTIESGKYFGVFDGSRLITITGDRMRVGAYCEISRVCVHPGFQGRGLARQLRLHLRHRQLGRSATTFRHAMRATGIAHAFYERLGFRRFKAPIVRAVTHSSSRPPHRPGSSTLHGTF